MRRSNFLPGQSTLERAFRSMDLGRPIRTGQSLRIGGTSGTVPLGQESKRRMLTRPRESSGCGSRWRTTSASRTKRRSEEHTSELQSPDHLVCRLLLEKKKKKNKHNNQPQIDDSNHMKQVDNT